MIWLVTAVVMSLGVAASWALCAYAGHLDDRAGYGDTWYVDPGDWPPTTAHTLTPEQVRRTLDEAFDRHYDAAVESLRNAGRQP